MTETMTKKKTGSKLRYGEAKTMVSFRLSPEALSIIKGIAQENISQAEVLEQWARQFKNGGNLADSAPATTSMSLERDIVASER